MTNLLGGALASALRGIAPQLSRASLQGCAGSEGNGQGFSPGELNYTTEQLGLLLAAISDKLTVAVGGRQLRTTDAGCLVEDIRQATEALVWGEKHDDGLFDLFCERQALAGFVAALLAPCVPQVVRVQIWQTLSILVQNARRTTSFYYLLSGGHLNTLLVGDPDLRNEETLAYFVAFMKSLSLRLDGETALLVLDRRPEAAWAGGFPLFAQTVRLATHRDHMICTAARAALLNLLRIDHPEVRSRASEAACQLLVPSIAGALRVSWAASSAALRLQDSETMRVALEAEDDLYGFINDLLMLDVDGVTEALAQGIIAATVLPLLACLAPPLVYPESCDGQQSDVPGVERQHSMMSSYDEAHWEVEQRQKQFVGTWFYGSGSSGSNFKIKRTEAGMLVFEEVSPKGRVVVGTLYPHGQWQEGEISYTEGDGYGRIRVRLVEEKMAVLANFRAVGESRWGPDTFAYQFLGTWFYGKESNCFQISMLDAGQLRYRETFPSGQRISGTLQPGGEWLQAEVKFYDGKVCGTVRLRFVSKNGTMISVFRGQGEKEFGPETTAFKATVQEASPTASFGPAAAEIARTVSSMVLGLEPVQQGFVGVVIDRVLGSQMSGLGEQRADEAQAPAAGSEAPPAEPPATAVALRALASCTRSLASHTGITVPLAKVLLWPTVPSALASGVYAPDAEAGRAASAAFGLAAAAGADGWPGQRARPQAATSRGAPPSVFVPNPFRAELLALLGGTGDGPIPREAPLAAWTLREMREVLPAYGLEDAGLMPPCAGHGALRAVSPAAESLSPRAAGTDGVLEPWLRHWVDPAATGTSSSSGARPGCRGVAMPAVLGGEAQDGCLPERLVEALHAQAGLSRMGQHAVAATLLDLVRPPEAQVARRRAKAAAACALKASGDALWQLACQDFDGNDGTCGVTFTEMIGGFLEEWEWYRDRDGRIDLLSTNTSVQSLLQCAHGGVGSPSAGSRSGGSLPGRQAIRTFLALRRLCTDLAALENRGPSGQDVSSRSKSKESCPLEMEGEHDWRGAAGRFPEVPCVGPWGGVYAQGHALVLHPTQVVVVEPKRLDEGGVHICVPSWRATALGAAKDARTLTLRVVAPLVGDAPSANRGGVEEVELRFQDPDAKSRALQHLQGAKASESRRLLSQLRAFIDRSIALAAAEPQPAFISAWVPRW